MVPPNGPTTNYIAVDASTSGGTVVVGNDNLYIAVQVGPSGVSAYGRRYNTQVPTVGEPTNAEFQVDVTAAGDVSACAADPDRDVGVQAP